MKRIVTLITAGSLLAAFALAQPGKTGYTIIDLGPVGSALGPNLVAGRGLVAGAAATPDGTATHAILWYKGQMFDLGQAGVGRRNSTAWAVNDLGQVVGEADSSIANGEDFCGFNAAGFKSSTACLPFLWQYGILKPLPTLGGANGWANGINNHGQAVGWAETAISDPDCPVSRFEPVLWEYGGVRSLPTLYGDTYGVAAAINDNGQVSGASGTCGAFNVNTGVYVVENHAMLWDRDGTPHDLGNLGGAGGIAGNHACALNNTGQVVGHSMLTNNATFHGFLWTAATQMQDIGTLPGDYASLALGINDAGQIVGTSIQDEAMTILTAVIWENGGITDLNKLVAANPAGLYLFWADSINSAGEIAGEGVAADGVHGFLATPNGDPNLAPALRSLARPGLEDNTRKQVLRRLGIRLP